MKMRGDIVGFVTGTRTSSFDEASMSVHDPAGPMLAIHSVVVAEGQRRQGIGAAMLAEYVRAVRRMGPKVPIDKIVLIAKAEKLAYYVRAGFSVVGVSPIVHGRDVWYECAVDLAAERRRAREAEAAEEAEAAGEAELAAGAVDGSGSGSGPDGGVGVGGGIGGGVAGGGGSGGGGGGGAPPPCRQAVLRRRQLRRSGQGGQRQPGRRRIHEGVRSAPRPDRREGGEVAAGHRAGV